jgi:hypothetical protein
MKWVDLVPTDPNPEAETSSPAFSPATSTHLDPQSHRSLRLQSHSFSPGCGPRLIRLLRRRSPRSGGVSARSDRSKLTTLPVARARELTAVGVSVHLALPCRQPHLLHLVPSHLHLRCLVLGSAELDQVGDGRALVCVMAARQVSARFKLARHPPTFRCLCPSSCSFGITLGYHRLWSHNAYQAALPLRVVLSLMGCLGFQGSIKWCVLEVS